MYECSQTWQTVVVLSQQLVAVVLSHATAHRREALVHRERSLPTLNGHSIQAAARLL